MALLKRKGEKGREAEAGSAHFKGGKRVLYRQRARTNKQQQKARGNLGKEVGGGGRQREFDVSVKTPQTGFLALVGWLCTPDLFSTQFCSHQRQHSNLAHRAVVTCI